MPFAALQIRPLAHLGPVQDAAAWYWHRRSWRLWQILEAGGWSIHDVINRPAIRAAVARQWRLSSQMEEYRRIEATISYLEHLDAASEVV
jgi:hypothetical protein